MNREFLMLSQTYKAKKHDIRGWYGSEKLDGHRVWWDGGITRGMLKSSVPWANNDKDERYVTPPKATGLWTRYGNVFHAPDWWLDELPRHPLDGELFAERGKWQKLSSAIKRINPDPGSWEQVYLHAFDCPPYSAVLANGKVNNPNFIKEFEIGSFLNFARRQAEDRGVTMPKHLSLLGSYVRLQEIAEDYPRVKAVVQTCLKNEAHMLDLYNEIVAGGGEGLIVRHAQSYWEPKRSHMSVKVKPENDAEGVVIGYTWGRETDKGSKLLGKMGALIMEWNGPLGKQQFELSGFTDAERFLTRFPITDGGSDYPQSVLDEMAQGEGFACAGEETSDEITNPKFPRGTVVTFKYTEVTDDGKPKCARFHRKAHVF